MAYIGSLPLKTDFALQSIHHWWYMLFHFGIMSSFVEIFEFEPLIDFLKWLKDLLSTAEYIDPDLMSELIVSSMLNVHLLENPFIDSRFLDVVLDNVNRIIQIYRDFLFSKSDVTRLPRISIHVDLVLFVKSVQKSLFIGADNILISEIDLIFVTVRL